MLKTRAGNEVRILDTFDVGPRPIVGAYFAGEGEGWIPCSWGPDGMFLADGRVRHLDLVTAELEAS
jgi:hypothetical protein